MYFGNKSLGFLYTKYGMTLRHWSVFSTNDILFVHGSSRIYYYWIDELAFNAIWTKQLSDIYTNSAALFGCLIYAKTISKNRYFIHNRFGHWQQLIFLPPFMDRSIDWMLKNISYLLREQGKKRSLLETYRNEGGTGQPG